jgi:replicative DNA helicase
MENRLMSEIPHAIGPEKSVLSSIFKSPEILDECPHLTPAHFHLPGHRLMFEKAMETIAKGQTLELVSFVQMLVDAGQLDHVGGPAAITGIFGYAPNHAHFRQHLRILTDKFALRQAIALSRDVQEAIDSGEDPGAVAEMVANRSTMLSDTLAEAKPAEDTKALLRLAAKRWEELAAGRVDAMGMETSLTEINRRFRGLRPRRVTVISALPSHGKTLLGGQLFMDCVLAGHRGLFLTWEMTPNELTDRFVAYAAHMPIDAVADPLKHAFEVDNKTKPTELTVTNIRRGFNKLAGADYVTRPMHGQSFTQAFAAIRKEHRKAPLKVVALDFIQRIAPARGMERETYERQLTNGAEQFQNLADELGFHGILLSQLNKDGAAKHAEGINESCALHLKIEKTKDFHGIGVVKDRFHGQTGRGLPIILDEKTQRFIHDHQSKN